NNPDGPVVSDPSNTARLNMIQISPGSVDTDTVAPLVFAIGYDGTSYAIGSDESGIDLYQRASNDTDWTLMSDIGPESGQPYSPVVNGTSIGFLTVKSGDPTSGLTFNLIANLDTTPDFTSSLIE